MESAVEARSFEARCLNPKPIARSTSDANHFALSAHAKALIVCLPSRHSRIAALSTTESSDGFDIYLLYTFLPDLVRKVRCRLQWWPEQLNRVNVTINKQLHPAWSLRKLRKSALFFKTSHSVPLSVDRDCRLSGGNVA